MDPERSGSKDVIHTRPLLPKPRRGSIPVDSNDVLADQAPSTTRKRKDLSAPTPGTAEAAAYAARAASGSSGPSATAGGAANSAAASMLPTTSYYDLGPAVPFPPSTRTKRRQTDNYDADPSGQPTGSEQLSIMGDVSQTMAQISLLERASPGDQPYLQRPLPSVHFTTTYQQPPNTYQQPPYQYQQPPYQYQQPLIPYEAENQSAVTIPRENLSQAGHQPSPTFTGVYPSGPGSRLPAAEYFPPKYHTIPATANPRPGSGKVFVCDILHNPVTGELCSLEFPTELFLLRHHDEIHLKKAAICPLCEKPEYGYKKPFTLKTHNGQAHQKQYGIKHKRNAVERAFGYQPCEHEGCDRNMDGHKH